MRTNIERSHRAQQGYALMLTLLFISICVVMLASLCQWTANESALTARNNAYNCAVAAAEGATEVAIAQMNRDFFNQSLSQDESKYSGIVPATFITNGWAADYRFHDGRGNANLTDIYCKGWESWTNLDAEFTGLYGMVNSYEITSTATKSKGPYPVSAAVRQSVTFTAIPIFQYSIFYSLDLEICPGAPMIITGKTHGNGDIYVAPGDSLQFSDTVTAVGRVYTNRLDDPTARPRTPTFSVKPFQVSSMTLPIGMDNSPTNVVKILEVPPAGENVNSELGRQRFYNKSDLIVTVNNDSVTVKYNNNAEGSTLTTVPRDNVITRVVTNLLGLVTTLISNVPGSTGYSFVNTNVSFYDYREGKQVLATEIDIRALTNWLARGDGFAQDLVAQAQTGHHINSIYVDDQRSVAGKLTAVRVTNGRYLPQDGLTVATARPLYVKGQFNAPDLTPGLTNTAATKPAALVSDAITVLSQNWNDSWGPSTALGDRDAANTTVNAAFLSGIVQTKQVNGRSYYSGGVENFPRFLEDWAGKTMTYNGSMVVMFDSQQATNFWIAPGTYYNPPTRKWAFDRNFLEPGKLPPNTPQVRKLQRGKWSVVAANYTDRPTGMAQEQTVQRTDSSGSDSSGHDSSGSGSSRSGSSGSSGSGSSGSGSSGSGR